MTRGSNTPKCTCDAYPFPHRMGGGQCIKKYVYPGPDEMDLARDEAIRKSEEKQNDSGNSGK